MSSLKVTYWAIIDHDDELWCGSGSATNGLYTSEARAQAQYRNLVKRHEKWAEIYKDDPEHGPRIRKELAEVREFRVVPVKIVEVTLDGETL